MEEETTRFASLDPAIRDYLAHLTEEDVVLIRSGVELVRSAMTVSRFLRWLIISLAGAFLGAVMVWDAGIRLSGWLRGLTR